MLIKVESIEERERWVNSLEKAATLKIEDLYDFENEKNETDPLSKKIELGKGKYSTIYATRRKIGPTSSLELENESSEPLFPSDDEDYNPPDLDCTIKIISKSIFWGRVRERSERVDTLVRETAVHATLTAHSNRMRQSPPFLKLQNFCQHANQDDPEIAIANIHDHFENFKPWHEIPNSPGKWSIAFLFR